MRHKLTLLLVSILSFSGSAIPFARYYSPGDSILYVQYAGFDIERPDISLLYRFHEGGAWVDQTVNDSLHGLLITFDRVPGTVFSQHTDPEGPTYGIVSVDYGETWEEINAPFRHAYSGEAGENEGESIILNDNSWVFYTSDSWVTYDSVYLQRPDSISRIQLFKSNGHLLGQTLGSHHYCFSPDTGRTWGVGYQNPYRRNYPLYPGVPGELWGWAWQVSNDVLVYLVTDSCATLDTIAFVSFPERPLLWHVSIIPTDNPGELFVYGDIEYWFPPTVEIELFHIQNYGANIDSYHYYFPYYEIEDAITISPIPDDFDLMAYPNPFNPASTISFSLPQTQHTSISVYDLTGRLVSTLANEMMNAGEHNVTFDASGLPSGIYFAHMTAGSQMKTQKMVLLK